MSDLQLVLAISLAAPLLTALAVLLFSNQKNIRDICGPVGGLITFISAVVIASAVMDGKTVSNT